MNLKQYRRIIYEIYQVRRQHCVQHLKETFTDIPSSTLKSIYSNECQRAAKVIHPQNNTPESQAYHYQRYKDLSDRGDSPGIIIRMADEIRLSPSLLARIILEHYVTHQAKKEDGSVEPNAKQALSKMMRNTGLIPDGNLALEVFMCNLDDTVYSPITECIKQEVGEEYEERLKKTLESLNIPYLDETKLRSNNFDKTPDVKLEIPIAVDGQPVNWIESKALFGDPDSHNMYMNKQYLSYMVRFGPGMVIYWLGFVDELNVHRKRGLIVKSGFPDNFIYMKTENKHLVK